MPIFPVAWCRSKTASMHSLPSSSKEATSLPFTLPRSVKICPGKISSTGYSLSTANWAGEKTSSVNSATFTLPRRSALTIACGTALSFSKTSSPLWKTCSGFKLERSSTTRTSACQPGASAPNLRKPKICAALMVAIWIACTGSSPKAMACLTQWRIVPSRRISAKCLSSVQKAIRLVEILSRIAPLIISFKLREALPSRTSTAKPARSFSLASSQLMLSWSVAMPQPT